MTNEVTVAGVQKHPCVLTSSEKQVVVLNSLESRWIENYGGGEDFWSTFDRKNVAFFQFFSANLADIKH